MFRKIFSVQVPQDSDAQNQDVKPKPLPAHLVCNYPVLREIGASSSQFEILRYPSGEASGLLSLGGQVQKWDYRPSDGIMVIACSSSSRQKPFVNIMRVEDHECQFLTQYPMIGEPNITALSLHPSECKFAITKQMATTKIYGFEADGSRFDSMSQFHINGTTATCFHGRQGLLLGTAKGNVFSWDTRMMSSNPTWTALMPEFSAGSCSRRNALITKIKMCSWDENEMFVLWRESGCNLGVWDLRMGGEKGPVREFLGVDSRKACMTGPVHFDVAEVGERKLVAACSSKSTVGIWDGSTGGEPLETLCFDGEKGLRARFVGRGTDIVVSENGPGLWVETDQQLHSLEFAG